jgi:membrane-bound metal-dependent hydrolase YbcI (DUF457 family)
MTPIAHTSVALLGWQVCADKKTIKTLALFVLLSSLSDFDFLFGRHQFFTHNIFFALLAPLPFFSWFKHKRERLGLYLVSFSHLVLDLLVIDRVKPIGIPLFYPLVSRYFNLGIFPNMERGPMPGIFSSQNLVALLLENLLFLLPVLLYFRRRFRAQWQSPAFWSWRS